VTNPQPPAPAQWTPPAEPGRPASNGRVVLALVVIGLIAVAALVVGIVDLARPNSSGNGKAASTSVTPSPTFTPDQVASAKKNLCSVYQVASRSVNADTNGTDIAIARISLTNAAGMLDMAADNLALGQSERDAARTLASAYHTYVAAASVFDKTSAIMQNALDDANRADGAMAAICQ
jgi:hypothetical protein